MSSRVDNVRRTVHAGKVIDVVPTETAKASFLRTMEKRFSDRECFEVLAITEAVRRGIETGS